MRIATLLFLIIPLAEMILLIEVGSMIGALPTVALVVLTAVVGVWLLRMEGLATLARVQEKLNRGEIPETELLEGIMLVFGGALLLTPGFMTDFLGFVCLIPGLRRPLASRIIQSAQFRTFQMNGSGFSASFQQNQPRGPGQGQRQGPGQTIDGEFESDSTNDDHHIERR